MAENVLRTKTLGDFSPSPWLSEAAMMLSIIAVNPRSSGAEGSKP
jgi:hypothetical protein